MGKKIITAFISLLLSVGIFVGSIVFLSLYDISHGIKKQNIIEIVDEMEIEEELKQFEVYNKLGKDKQKIITKVFEDESVEGYIKETIKNIYIGIIYDEEMNIEEENLTMIVDKKLEQDIEKYGMTEEDIEIIKNITNQIEKDIKEIKQLELDKKPEIQIIRTLFSKKTAYYALALAIVLSIAVIAINEKHTGLIWSSVPVIASGALFLLLSLSMDGTIQIEGNISLALETIEPLIKTIKISSIVYIVIGIIEIGIYEISKLKENGVTYGENQSI
jgi:hypothetical protein